MPTSSRRRAGDTVLGDHALIRRALVATRRDFVLERWHRGAPAVDEFGRETDPNASESVAWCVQSSLLGHLRDGSNATILAAMRLLHRIARRVSDGRHDTLFAFNDAPDTTAADIDRLLHAAISEAGALAAGLAADATDSSTPGA